MTSSDIDDCGLIEFYVVGKNFEWCYVVTHELDLCGPYFCFKRNSKKQLLAKNNYKKSRD